jgi:hypothetical protein
VGLLVNRYDAERLNMSRTIRRKKHAYDRRTTKLIRVGYKLQSVRLSPEEQQKKDFIFFSDNVKKYKCAFLSKRPKYRNECKAEVHRGIHDVNYEVQLKNHKR